MRERTGQHGVVMGPIVFLACWAVAAVVALLLGRDANHDLRHYHFHNAWALLEGRWVLDLAPAGTRPEPHQPARLGTFLL